MSTIAGMSKVFLQQSRISDGPPLDSTTTLCSCFCSHTHGIFKDIAQWAGRLRGYCLARAVDWRGKNLGTCEPWAKVPKTDSFRDYVGSLIKLKG